MLRSMNSIKLWNDQYFGKLYLEEQKRKKKKMKGWSKEPANFILKRMLEYLATPWDSAVS